MLSANRVQIAEDPLYGKTRGPCRNVEHGKRIVERILAIRLCMSSPEERERRWRMRRERVLRLRSK